MLTAILALSSLATIDISISAGYYSLAELSASLSKQGVRVQAASDCSGDLYVVRAPALPWLEFRDALAADGRLTVWFQDNRWTISRSTASRMLDEAAARRFVSSFGSAIYQVYNGAAVETAAYLKGPVSARERDFNKVAHLQATDPLVRAKDQLVYRCAMESDMPFFELGAPAYVSSFTEPFGRVRVSPLTEIPGAFAPGGDLRTSPTVSGLGMKDASDEDIEKLKASIALGGKLSLEPLTGTTSFRLITYMLTLFNGELDLAEAKMITPNAFKVAPSPEALWGKQELAVKQTRIAGTAGLFLNSSSVLPSESSARVSEALLSWAETTNQSLLCHVSAMTDYVVSGQTGTSPGKIVEAVNKGDVDLDWVTSLVAERAAPTKFRKPTGLEPGLRLSAVRSGRLLVFRGESGYIDALNPWRDNVPSSFFNQLHKGQPPTLSELAKHVSSLKLQNLRNSFFPSTYLEFCNPYTLRPFALAIEKSAKFKAVVLGVEQGHTVKVPFTDLDAAATSALLTGMSECAELSDALTLTPDPMMSVRHIQNTKKPLTLAVTRTATGFEFSVVEGYNLWRAWVKNVGAG